MNIILELEKTAALNLVLTTAWLSVGLLGTRLFRTAPVRAHLILFLAIAGCLIGPMLHGAARWWNLTLTQPEIVASIGRRIVPLDPGLSAHSALERADEVPGAGPTDSTVVPKPGGAILPADSGRTTAVATYQPARSWSWRRMLAVCWLGLSMAVMLRLFASICASAVVLWRSKPLADPALHGAAGAASRSLNLKAAPVLRSCRAIQSPAIWCWHWKPVLLVPESLLTNGGVVHWESLLCHELSHWRRRDHFTSLLAELALIVFPCQPLIWIARRQLHRWCELACDARVIASGYPRDQYAESLLELVPHGHSVGALSAVSSKKDLERRLDRILNGSASSITNGRGGSWGIFASFMALGLCAAVMAFPQTGTAHGEPESSKSRAGTPEGSSRAGAVARRIDTGKPRISYGLAVVSPNGRYLAGHNYGGDFYILDVPANKKTKLYDADELAVTRPVWSADSQRLLLNSPEKIVVHSLETGESKVFLEGKRIAVHDWSPDGKTLVATAPAWRPNSAFLISTETKEETPLDLGEAAQLSEVSLWQRITFSSDGKMLLYVTSEGARSVLHVRALDGTFHVRYDEFLGRIEDPMWSDDGRHVLFIGKQGGSVDLLGLRFENRQFAGFPIMIKPDAKNVRLLNPVQGGQLAYRHYFEGSLYTVEMNPETARPVGKLKRILPGGWTEHGWSPDSKKIVRILRPTGEDFVLGIIDATTGEVVQQLPLPGINMAKVGQSWWTAHSIVIGASGSQKQPGLYEVRLDTGAINLLMPHEGRGVIWYHSIGAQNRVAYGLGRRAYVYDLAQKKQLLALPKDGDSDKWMIRPAISADGERVTYQKGSELWVVAIDDGQERLLFDFGKMNYRVNVHSWAPNGKYLSVIAFPKDGNNELWMLPTGGGEPFHIPLPLELGEGWFPQWSPDGKHLAIHFWTDEEFQYWILSNYMPESSKPPH